MHHWVLDCFLLYCRTMVLLLNAELLLNLRLCISSCNTAPILLLSVMTFLFFSFVCLIFGIFCYFILLFFVLLSGRCIVHVFVWLCNLCWQCNVVTNNLFNLTWFKIFEYGSLYSDCNFQTDWYLITIYNLTSLWL